jgi:hypothetical protein
MTIWLVSGVLTGLALCGALWAECEAGFYGRVVDRVVAALAIWWAAVGVATWMQ